MNSTSNAAFADAAAADNTPLPPAPHTIEETGLSQQFLGDLLCKLLFLRGRMSLANIAEQVKLPAALCEHVLDGLRDEHLCQLVSRGDTSATIFYQLSGAGCQRAAECLRRSQYVGPAPVTLAAYTEQVLKQSVRTLRYTREQVAAGFDGMVVNEGILDQLGAGMNSGRAMIFYGPAGSGKTLLVRQLERLLSGSVAIPHAVLADNEVIQFFDPHVHRPLPRTAAFDSFLRRQSEDARWVRCRRPMAIAGGEMTLDTLDLEFDHTARFYQAPPHVKANNGIFVVDDLGRQIVSPQALMNRWIGPLDQHHDYLTLHTGYKFRIPFDMIVVFSSNLDPVQLGDDALLRRIGYKIHVGALSERHYRTVFQRVCDELGIAYSEAAMRHLLRERHDKEGRPLLACYPRDLLSQLRDRAQYESGTPELTPESIDWAWRNYFVPARPAAVLH